MLHFSHLNEDNSKTALLEAGVSVSYGEVARRIAQCAAGLLAGRAKTGTRPVNDLAEERVALMFPASTNYVVTLHGIWRAGGIAIPLNPASAESELEYYLGSTGVTRLLADESELSRLRPLCERLGIGVFTMSETLALAKHASVAPMASTEAPRRAMILFTSGTTSKPKGVVFTHAAIKAQITTLVTAWEWRDTDVIPLFLPLHHVHGIINILSCALWVGATVHLMPRLDLHQLCEEVAADTYSVLMAVPTVYVKLIDYIKESSKESPALGAAFGRMRLHVSGSAACPVKVFEQWQALTGQVLLERYGMTEVGMAISNPYQGERRAGYIGQPLPGVTVQLFDENNVPVTTEGTPGEIRMKGQNVFREYWNNEAATRDSFKDDWFCSGDIAVIEDGYYRVMGRASIDIIKSGGYKLSALEIEGVLLNHEAIREVAVVGAPDATWGEAVVAVVVLKPSAHLELAALKAWCHDRMSSYKIPKRLEIRDALPRNAMGKVTKPALIEQLTDEQD